MIISSYSRHYSTCVHNVLTARILQFQVNSERVSRVWADQQQRQSQQAQPSQQGGDFTMSGRTRSANTASRNSTDSGSDSGNAEGDVRHRTYLGFEETTESTVRMDQETGFVPVTTVRVRVWTPEGKIEELTEETWLAQTMRGEQVRRQVNTADGYEIVIIILHMQAATGRLLVEANETSYGVEQFKTTQC